MELLIINNRDSFTFNLVETFRRIGLEEVVVLDAHQTTPEQADQADSLLFSPGPGLPGEFPLMHQLLERYQGKKRILGICLGHQAIATFFGAKLVQMKTVVHGATAAVHLAEPLSGIFQGLEPICTVGLYHSWVVSADSLPDCLQVTARSDAGYIMGLKHKEFPVEGVQFHPESILTPGGQQLLNNWIKTFHHE